MLGGLLACTNITYFRVSNICYFRLNGNEHGMPLIQDKDSHCEISKDTTSCGLEIREYKICEKVKD